MNYEKRDKDILKKRENGETYQSIGDYFGLTRERVRQILDKYGKAGLRSTIHSA